MGNSFGWLGLTVRKPRGHNLCVWGRPHNRGAPRSGSAASHADPGSTGMLEFGEESPEER